jgi:hypothetical protein
VLEKLPHFQFEVLVRMMELGKRRMKEVLNSQQMRS